MTTQIIALLISSTLIIPAVKDWRFSDVPKKNRKQISLVCRNGVYSWKYPYDLFSVPAQSYTEYMVKCNEE